MPEESKTTELTAISKGLEASKVLGPVALVLYVVGFLVVTFHLAQFGFVPVSWLRPQYLLAGIWCLLPTLLLVWIVSYGIGQSLTLLGKTPGTQPPPKSGRFRNLTGAFLSVVGFVIATRAGFGLIELMLGQPITVRLWRPHAVIALKLVGFYLATLITGIAGVVMLIGARTTKTAYRTFRFRMVLCDIAPLRLPRNGRGLYSVFLYISLFGDSFSGRRGAPTGRDLPARQRAR